MTTAAQVVKQILNEINVRASESDLAADEVQDTIFTMNAYMSDLAASGVDLGYTEVSDLGDTITVHPGAIMGMVANVAMMMCPTFGQSPNPALVLKARKGLETMHKLGVTIVASDYASELPLGSGNEDCLSDHFYPGIADKIEKESGGSIILEN